MGKKATHTDEIDDHNSSHFFALHIVMLILFYFICIVICTMIFIVLFAINFMLEALENGFSAVVVEN